ncbi:MMPL family transporter [Solibacillus sp. A46]|uniref:MMPL family transporter n=1 Tax=Solibacillus faecavium TaxID=2762221 RepID=A0ABR8Y2U9_9BACL|nr:MMPL family transporter [Solibacillus faecavium]MBD8038364.1 MMPL family transporter [Solibacillus faecavium]
MSKHPLEKWGSAMGGKNTRWIVVGLWIVFAVTFALIFPQINSVENFAGDEIPETYTSIQAGKILEEEFASDSGIPLLITWYNESGITEQDLTNIQGLYKQLADDPLNGQESIPPFHELPAQALMGLLSENGAALVTPVFFSPDKNTDVLKENLAIIKERTEEQFGENPYESNLEDEGLHARFSGPVGISIDATDLFKAADVQLMIATVIIILVILLLIYRSPILAIIPLVVVGIAYLVVSPLLGVMAENGWIDKDAQAVAIMIVLLFGAGTDYCLFLITRYRDILLTEENKFTALAMAVRESTGAIVMSGLTVVIGLATLALADYGAFQRFAVPFSFGVLITGFAVVTLLPAVLGILGRAAFWPFVPRTESAEKAHAEKKNKPYKPRKPNHRYMRAVGEFVTTKPWLVIVIAGVILIGLAFASTNIKYNYDLISSFPEDMPSREGFTIIEDNFTPGELAPVQLLVDSEGTDINITEQLLGLPYVSIVKEMRTGDVNNNIQLYEIDLDKNPYSNEAMDDVEQMKDDVKSILTENNLEDGQFWIGGETSAQLDTKVVQSGDENIIQPVMIIIIFIVLLGYLRALITSIQLMVTVLISFFSALGAGWLIIHYGLGHEAMASAIPLYSFVFIIALGNDYNIFMISDIWKNRKRGIAHREAIVNGIASTGAVITSAGLILAGTFLVLATLPIQLLVQFGIVTAVGVLLDTFVVRPLLVPAIITVFGKWSYWPNKKL